MLARKYSYASTSLKSLLASNKTVHNDKSRWRWNWYALTIVQAHHFNSFDDPDPSTSNWIWKLWHPSDYGSLTDNQLLLIKRLRHLYIHSDPHYHYLITQWEACLCGLMPSQNNLAALIQHMRCAAHNASPLCEPMFSLAPSPSASVTSTHTHTVATCSSDVKKQDAWTKGQINRHYCKGLPAL